MIDSLGLVYAARWFGGTGSFGGGGGDGDVNVVGMEVRVYALVCAAMLMF